MERLRIGSFADGMTSKRAVWKDPKRTCLTRCARGGLSLYQDGVLPRAMKSDDGINEQKGAACVTFNLLIIKKCIITPH